MVREDQSVHTSDYKTFEVSATVNAKDLLSSGTQAIRDMLRTMSEGLAKEFAQTFQKTMEEATDEAGTVVHAGGRSISAELLVEGFDKIEFCFDDNGNWEMPTLVIHPSQGNRLKEALARLDSDSVLREHMIAMLEKKREAWRVREAHRTLVD